ncbi:hypothetical protein INR49_018157 [Caranx melampygus]|nr:hypothetical protein INR49_018157 [Caranx melampygus]
MGIDVGLGQRVGNLFEMRFEEVFGAATQHRSEHHERGPGMRGRAGGCHVLQQQLEEDGRRHKGPQQFCSFQALDSAGPIESGQEGLHVLRAVVLGVEQQHRKQLRCPDPRRHQPVGYIVCNGWHQPAQVREHVIHVFPCAVLNDCPGGLDDRHSNPGVLMSNRLHERLDQTLSLHLSLLTSGKGSMMVLGSMVIISFRYGAKCFPHTSTVRVNISTADNRSSSAGSRISFSPSLWARHGMR